VLGHELAVEQREAADLEPGDQPRERNLRCVGPAAEHALAEEGPAQFHAIEAADERAIAPDFDGMSVTGGVKRMHRPLEFGIDPGFLAVGASGDDAAEIGIARHREAARPQRSSKRAGQMEPIERQDRAIARLDPEQLGGIAAVGHREDARCVTLQQETRIEATHLTNHASFPRKREP
jgi:hypothetical protein